MTRDQLSDLDVTTPADFEAVLAEVVETAFKSDVDVRGAWNFRTDGSTHDWEVEIFELARHPDDEDE